MDEIWYFFIASLKQIRPDLSMLIVRLGLDGLGTLRSSSASNSTNSLLTIFSLIAVGTEHQMGSHTGVSTAARNNVTQTRMTQLVNFKLFNYLFHLLTN